LTVNCRHATVVAVVEDSSPAQIAARIRGHREAAGLSQQVLATRAGIAIRTLSRAEAGETLTVPTLAAIAAALDVSLADLVADPQRKAS